MMGKDGSAYSVPETGAAAAAPAAGGDALLPGTPGKEQLPPLARGRPKRAPTHASEDWKNAEKKVIAGLGAVDLHTNLVQSSGRSLKDLVADGQRSSAKDATPHGSSTACCGCQPLNPESNQRLIWDILLVSTPSDPPVACGLQGFSDRSACAVYTRHAGACSIFSDRLRRGDMPGLLPPLRRLRGPGPYLLRGI